jgi:hypothetical protein
MAAQYIVLEARSLIDFLFFFFALKDDSSLRLPIRFLYLK